MSALTYLDREGISIKQTLQLEEVMLDVAQGELDEKGLSEVLFALYTAGV